MNYTELQERVADHFVSTELIPYIPTAIKMAEAKLNRDPRFRVRDMIATDTPTLSSQFADLPGDFLALRSAYITGSEGYRLEYKTYAQLRDAKECHPDTGDPYWFTIVGGKMEFVPVPDAAKNLEIVYYQRIPALSDVNLTNWLIDNHPDIYLYGALMQASPYMHQDKRIPTWEAFYTSAVEELVVDSERAEYSGGPIVARAKAL